MKFEVEYYDQQIKDEIKAWPTELYADFLRLVSLIEEFGPVLRLPHSRAMGNGVFELRPRGQSGIGRAFYCFLIGRRVVILHAFIKKTRKTPEKDLKIARKRASEVKND